MNARITALLVACTGAPVFAADTPSEEQPISKYLVDVNGGSVSAAGIINLDNSAVRTIQTAQDFALALKPFSSDDSKAGVGISFTPARTELVPVAGSSYYDHPVVRLLSNLTLSYAQNEIDIGDATYRQRGYSVDTWYYFDRDQDPAVAYSVAWSRCAKDTREQNQKALAGLSRSDPDFDKKLQEITANRGKLLGDCADNAVANMARWNAAKASISYGDGRIARQGTGERFGLGRRITLNALVGIGDSAAVNLTVQRVRDALDPQSLATTPTRKTSNLAALRYTYAGTGAASRTRALAEASNAGSSQGSALKGVFIVAAGVDYRVMDSKEFPLWLSLRVGRTRSVESGRNQTTALFTLNFQKTTTLPQLDRE